MRAAQVTRRAEVCRQRSSKWSRARARVLTSSMAIAAIAAASSCLERPLGSPVPVTTNLFVDRIQQTAVSELDLLFMIDSSASMSDKQSTLERAVPDLVNRLVNPPCIDAEGRARRG